MPDSPATALQIGPLRLDFPVMLAPMAGYTDSAMRSLAMEHGCGLTFTEVANAQAIARGVRVTMHLLETTPVERPIVAHMYGCDPRTLADAAAAIEALGRFDAVDLNCGCPVRRIVAKGAGAALIVAPARVEAIVRAIAGRIRLPVTVKTRIGFHAGEENVRDVAAATENGGGAAIFVHARPAASRHGGDANWDALARLKAACRLPVIGNGGVTRAADAERMLRQTGVDGVMIGRAAIGNPWIFRQIRALLASRPTADPTPAERRAVIAEHLARLVRLKTLECRHRRRSVCDPSRSAAMLFRATLLHYLAGFDGCGELRRSLNSLTSVEAVMAAVDRVLGLP